MLCGLLGDSSIGNARGLNSPVKQPLPLLGRREVPFLTQRLNLLVVIPHFTKANDGERVRNYLDGFNHVAVSLYWDSDSVQEVDKLPVPPAGLVPKDHHLFVSLKVCLQCHTPILIRDGLICGDGCVEIPLEELTSV